MQLLKCQSIDSHLLNHGEKTIGAGGGEVLLETDSLDEIEFAIEDFVRGVVTEHLDDETY